MAQQLHSPALCSQIVQAGDRSSCEVLMAYQDKDPELCAKVELWRQRDDCFMSFITGGSLAGDGCERIQSAETKIRCYEQVARKNPIFCERVGAYKRSPRRANCYDKAFASLEDPALCTGIPDPAKVEACLAKVAGTRGDGSICEGLHDQFFYDACWKEIASKGKPEEACFHVKAPRARQDCASGTWVRASDPAICSLVKEADVHQCRKTLSMKGRN
jgi:hypothetical protein